MSADEKTAELSEVECACHCGNFLSQAMADAGRKYIRGHKSNGNGNGNGRANILEKVRKAADKIDEKFDELDREERIRLTESEADALWLKLKPEIKLSVVRELVCRNGTCKNSANAGGNSD